MPALRRPGRDTHGPGSASRARHRLSAAGARNIFRSPTAEENLTAVARPGRRDVGRAFEMFARLAERRRNLGNRLSGGERQMLAVARALVLNPRLVLLDEPLAEARHLIVPLS